MGLKIQALHIGTLMGLSKAALTYQRGYFERVDVPITMFAVTGGDHTVIVDTGTCGEDAARERHGIELSRPDSQHPLAALEAAGIDPSEVGTVVNTHLHWDHCANNDLFPNATVLVQNAELQYAVNPFEPNRKVYERRPGMQPDWMKVLGNVSAVAGDTEISPGIKVVHLPGHTPGSQGVVVQASDRTYLIAGDCVSCYENWTGDEHAQHIPSSFTNLGDYMQSFRKIEVLGADVIPSHDHRVIDQQHFR
ncbi:N-acyl homoserine lactonase family protein [Rhodococcus sp. NPDC057529]|uniref:N-acyl homoserine lactonase family protein n=1 Tax=Rhodococcus sp. NPDC057529 TaxID=3346158 RepID=UPI0036709C1B